MSFETPLIILSNNGSLRIVINLWKEETILISNDLVLIKNSQIKGNTIDAEGATSKKTKMTQVMSKKIQETWVAQFSSLEMVIGEDEFL
jgi:hypothetical protein